MDTTDILPSFDDADFSPEASRTSSDHQLIKAGCAHFVELLQTGCFIAPALPDKFSANMDAKMKLPSILSKRANPKAAVQIRSAAVCTLGKAIPGALAQQSSLTVHLIFLFLYPSNIDILLVVCWPFHDEFNDSWYRTARGIQGTPDVPELEQARTNLSLLVDRDPYAQRLFPDIKFTSNKAATQAFYHPWLLFTQGTKNPADKPESDDLDDATIVMVQTVRVAADEPGFMDEWVPLADSHILEPGQIDEPLQLNWPPEEPMICFPDNEEKVEEKSKPNPRKRQRPSSLVSNDDISERPNKRSKKSHQWKTASIESFQLHFLDSEWYQFHQLVQITDKQQAKEAWAEPATIDSSHS
ncbi:hypothetical protein C8J56DRAFT_899194 [Mycena floridula]|nr:hypothetical protein C8J56DRAFT_899194 [Mycena floridula]